MSQSDRLQEELRRVRGNKELLLPLDVVEWAKQHKDSALHQQFEWDNKAAGHQYRLWQARQLIALHIVTGEGERRSVSLSIDRRKGGYRDVEDVMRAPALREIMLNDALAELKRVKFRYSAVKELARVFEEIDRVDKAQSERAA